MFTLNALSGFKVGLDHVYSILKEYARLSSNGKTIVLLLDPKSRQYSRQ